MSSLETPETFRQSQNSSSVPEKKGVNFTEIVSNALLVNDEVRKSTSALQTITPEMVNIRARYCILLERVENTFDAIPPELHMALQKKASLNSAAYRLGESYHNTRSDIGQDLKKETGEVDAQIGKGIAKRNLGLYYFREGPSYRTLLFGANIKDFEVARNELVSLGEIDQKPAKLSSPKLKTVFQIIQSSWRPGGENLGLKTAEFVEMRDKEIERLKALPEAELEALLGESSKRIKALENKVQEFLHAPEVQKFREDFGKAIIVSKPLENAIMAHTSPSHNAGMEATTQAPAQKQAISR